VPRPACSGAWLAFDTVEHQLLLSILQKHFAITDSALVWLQSFSTRRSQTVDLHADVSDAIYVDCGVLQGLMLGLKSFIAYVEEMDNIFEAQGLHRHAFADDADLHQCTECNSCITAIKTVSPKSLTGVELEDYSLIPD